MVDLYQKYEKLKWKRCSEKHVNKSLQHNETLTLKSNECIETMQNNTKKKHDGSI